MRNIANGIIVVIFLATNYSLHAQSSIDFSIGAKSTKLKDEINSQFNFKGIIPSILLEYSSKNNKRFHQVGFNYSMGNPTQIHDFSSLFVELKFGYRYLKKINTTNLISFGGGGIQSYGNFLISELGKTTYIYETSLNLNYMIDIPLEKNIISISGEIPFLSLISRSPYAVYTPELREQLNTPFTIPFYNYKAYLPFNYWRFSGNACINRNIGQKWNFGLNYRYEYMQYNDAKGLDYAKLVNSVYLIVKFNI